MGGGVVVRKLFEGSQERDVEVKLGKGEGMMRRPSYGGLEPWTEDKEGGPQHHVTTSKNTMPRLPA